MGSTQPSAGLVSVTTDTEYIGSSDRGENILLTEAFSLLDYLCLFRESKFSAVDDVIKSKVISEIIKYQKKIQFGSYEKFVCEAASYCLCAAIDEAVLENAESLESSWASQTLLCSFHSDTWGGERVFELYEQARKNNLHDLEELIFVIISLGFTGKYFDSSIDIESIRKHFPSKPTSEISGLQGLIHPVSVEHFNITQKASLIKMAAIFVLLIWSILNIDLWYLFANNTNYIKQNIEQLRHMRTL